jgi:voltage-dependent potassium channel beta subunit
MVSTQQNTMEYRYLGNTGLRVSILAFGHMLTTETPDAYEFYKAAVKRCYEFGVNYFDTAEVYSAGLAETQLGRVLKELEIPRENLVISTKIFRSGFLPNQLFLSRKHIIEGLNNSLKRLQLDYVDIVFCHRPDYDTPLEETCKAMSYLIEQGKAFYWGTSEWPADRISKAIELCERLNLHKPVVEQSEYNMLIRDKLEKNYRRLFSENGYGTTIYSPVAGGLLTGKYKNGEMPEGTRFWINEQDPLRKRLWRKYMSEEKREKTLTILSKLEQYANELGYT